MEFITSTDASKLQRVQRKFAFLYHSLSFLSIPVQLCEYFSFLKYSCFVCEEATNAVFLVNVYCSLDCCHFILEAIRLRFPSRNIRDLQMTTADCLLKS